MLVNFTTYSRAMQDALRWTGDVSATIHAVESGPDRALVANTTVEGGDGAVRSFVDHLHQDDSVITAKGANDETSQRFWIEYAAGICDVAAYQVAVTNDGVFERAWSDGDGWVTQMRFPDRDSFKSFHSQVTSRGTGLSINSIEDCPELPRDDGLTAKQREAVRLAHAEGYFETPQRTTLSALSDQVGISHQAFSERLNRGLRQLVETYATDERGAE